MDDEERIDVGNELVDVERRPRAGVVVSVTLSAEEAQHLFRAAAAQGVPISTFARDALLTELSQAISQHGGSAG